MRLRWRSAAREAQPKGGAAGERRPMCDALRTALPAPTWARLVALRHVGR
jgi:hypothetical protein